jgi:hypothetical protein
MSPALVHRSGQIDFAAASAGDEAKTFSLSRTQAAGNVSSALAETRDTQARIVAKENLNDFMIVRCFTEKW